MLKGSVLKHFRACIALAAYLGVHSGVRGKLSADGDCSYDEDGHVQAYAQNKLHEKALEIYQQQVVIIMKKKAHALWQKFPLRGLAIGTDITEHVRMPLPQLAQ